MFGYVQPQKSELLVREFEEYRGIYCALCRRLGKDYGFPARFFLNYDSTFFVVLLLSLSGECPRFAKGRCVVNPLKRCVFCEGSDQELGIAAALTVILSYYKLKDNISDSAMRKRLAYFLLLPIVSHARRHAAERYPELDKSAGRMMKRQTEIEHSEFFGIDRCAEPTADMVADILEMPVQEIFGRGSPEDRVSRQFGYYLGRWIYLIDAADDLEDDIRSGSFNPFRIKFSLNSKSTPEDIQNARGYAREVLNATMARMTAAANLIDFQNCLGGIVQNVIFKGLPEMQKDRLHEKERRNVRPL